MRDEDDLAPDAVSDKEPGSDKNDQDLAGLLVAAVRPRDLPADVHERILARALGVAGEDVAEAEPSARERTDADELREALEVHGAARDDHPLVRVADALRSAHAPRTLDPLKSEMLLKPALRLPNRKTAVRTLYGAAVTAVALAASLVGLLLHDVAPQAPEARGPQLLPGMVEARSTGDLFDQEDFPQTGGASERIDRIARARKADLRQNRFVSWGVP
jgi:hypothetical protein